MIISLFGLFFLAIAAAFVTSGLFAIFSRKTIPHADLLPFTEASIHRATRTMGLASLVGGLGLASAVLLNFVIFSIGFIGCTAGMFTFFGASVASGLIASRAHEQLVRKPVTFTVHPAAHTTVVDGCGTVA